LLPQRQRRFSTPVTFILVKIYMLISFVNKSRQVLLAVLLMLLSTDLLAESITLANKKDIDMQLML